MTNPFDDTATVADSEFFDDFNLSGEKRERPIPPGFKVWGGGLITEPGAYIGVPMEMYHGKECCAGPSTSSTGLKKLSGDKGPRIKGRTPRHFWNESSLNPNRKKIDTVALRMGRAFHDALLQPDLMPDLYHFTPKGFSRASTVKQAMAIAEADAAIKAGLCIMGHEEMQRINAMVDAARADPLFAALLGKGEPEVTIAWQDKETGVWVRARPDFMLANRRFALNVKKAADASYDGFSRAIGKFGYAQSAALEMDGYAAVFGDAPSAFLHPVIEEPAKGQWEEGDYIATAVWELPAEDIERGRWLNRMALRTFADCLAADKWDGYTPDPEPCGLPGYLRKLIDEGGQAEAANDAPTGNKWMEN